MHEAEPEMVTMDILKEMLDKQKGFYEDMMKHQETAFKCFI